MSNAVVTEEKAGCVGVRIAGGRATWERGRDRPAHRAWMRLLRENQDQKNEIARLRSLLMDLHYSNSKRDAQ